jgi:hypothetical protein
MNCSDTFMMPQTQRIDKLFLQKRKRTHLWRGFKHYGIHGAKPIGPHLVSPTSLGFVQPKIRFFKQGGGIVTPWVKLRHP